MPITTVPVTCRAFDQNGNPVRGAIYKATLNRVDSQPNVSDGLIVPELVTATSGADGVAVLNLWPNALGAVGSAYKVQATNPDTRRRFVDGYIVVPNAACELDAILTLTAPSPTPTPTPTPNPGGGGGGAGGGTSLTITAQAPLVADTATSGTAALSILSASGTRAGSMAAADKFKLDTVAANATANAADTFLRDRANHTGQQPSSTISDFAAAVTAVPGFGAGGGAGSTTPATLTYAPSIAINAASFKNFNLELTGDAVIENVQNLSPGQVMTLVIKQGAGGGKSITFGSDYKLGQFSAGFSLSRTEGSSDFLQFWKTPNDGVFLINFLQGFIGAVVAPPVGATPIPLNNQIAFIGDSRFDLITINNGTNVETMTAYGPAAWAMLASQYRGEMVGNYALNSSRVEDIQRRLTSVENRGEILNSTASIFVLLIGVNNPDNIAFTGPIYADIISQLTANNKIVVLLNELPDSDEYSRGATNVARRDFINATVFSGGNRVVKIDSYTLMNEPGGYEFKAGYAPPNDVHPIMMGNRVLGTAIGQVLDTLLAAGGFQPRNVPIGAWPDPAYLAVCGFFGTGGSVGNGATGVMADGWNGEDIPAGFNVAYSKGVDAQGYPEQIITVTGQSGALNSMPNWRIWNYNIAAGVAASADRVSNVSRVAVDAGNSNFMGVGVWLNANDNTTSTYKSAANFGVNVYDPGAAFRGTLAGESFSGTVRSQSCLLDAGWTPSGSKSLQPSFNFVFLGGVPVNAVIRLSRCGLSKVQVITGAAVASDTFMSKSGTNFSGMEWSEKTTRYGTSTKPNINYTVPRPADFAYLKATGYGKIRLPFSWELLQPVLHDSNPNAATRAIVGQPGAFWSVYQQYITNCLDAAAANGQKLLLDLHNYCRYQDFVYEPDGSINGLTVNSDPLIPPFTTNNTKVRGRIFALAAGATLTQANFTDFWVRVANLWRNHPGFGGYGLMNEPNTMPGPGNTVPIYSPGSTNNSQDLTIWPTYAIAAYNAIRAVDPTGLIYVGGNDWQNAMGFATSNPGFPIPSATNVIYDAHCYLDASSGGFRFDWDHEVSLGYSAGLSGSINENTGRDRLQLMANWANSFNPKLKVAISEIGMPIDDIRWQRSMENAMTLSKNEDFEIYTWMGGNHSFIHTYPINHIPQFHQNKTLEPTVSGPIKRAAGVNAAVLFDDGDNYALAGTPATITVYARGNLTAPLTVNVSTSGAGALSKSVLTIPAGANTSDSFTYTPTANQAAVITYTSIAAVPPPRTVYSYVDPVARAASNLAEGALTLMAKYKVSKWAAEDAYTDYMQGVPCVVGDEARAISDSGFGSTKDNPQEMLNWYNTANNALAPFSMPRVQVDAGKRYFDLGAYGTTGFWCKKRAPNTNTQGNYEPNPTNKPLWNLADPHFAISVVRIPSTEGYGPVFQAGLLEGVQRSEIILANGVPRAVWADQNGAEVVRTGAALALNTPYVLSMQSTGAAQSLRINTAVAQTGNNALPANNFNQMLMGWGFVSFYPREGFMGRLYGCAAGKGNPTNAELVVMERYMATLANLTL